MVDSRTERDEEHHGVSLITQDFLRYSLMRESRKKSDPSELSQSSTTSVAASYRQEASTRWSASILGRASDLARTLELYLGSH